MVSLRDRVDVLVRLFCGAAIAIGCYFVIEPFLTAIMLAGIVVIVTWPMYKRVENSLGDRPMLASSVMVVLLIVCLIIPLSFLAAAVAQQLPSAIKALSMGVKDFAAPVWLLDVPFIGAWLYEQLTMVFEPAAMADLLERVVNPLSRQVVSFAMMIGNGLVQMVLVAFIAFFFYKDGNYLSQRSMQLLDRISGGLSKEFSHILINTTRSVVYGIVGTAAGQGLVACIGFIIAGVPGTLLLSVAVFVLSVVPIGPPLVWGPAAFWLYSQGELGMALFMVAWGLFAIASVDNFLKPLLISRGTALPISLVFLGVFGGVIAFGFLGLILGPVLLAVGVAMVQTWLSQKNRKRIAREIASVTHVAPAAEPSEVKKPQSVMTPTPKKIVTQVKGLMRRTHPRIHPENRTPKK